jgi:hypothetical protein
MWVCSHKLALIRLFCFCNCISNQKIERSCICLLGVLVMTLSMIFRLGVGIVQTLWWFFFLILLHKFNTGLRSGVYQNKYCINKYNDFQQTDRQTYFTMFY